MRKKSVPAKEKSLKDLYERPGFMLRRAHQISVSLFLAEVRGVEVTTTQYGVLVILQKRENLDQIGLSKLVGLDRSTTALVVGKLETAGYVVRQDDPADGRRKVLVLTAKGADAVRRLNAPAERARLQALSAFSTSEAVQFLALLKKFVDTFNHIARAPIETADKSESVEHVAKAKAPKKTARPRTKT
jgi:DNA-binding MarR family transcriptional regulator